MLFTSEQNNMASRFASREFYPFEESKVNIWDWLFTGVVYTKIVIPLGVGE